MKRLVAGVALALAALPVTPASAGCVEDFLAPEKNPAPITFADAAGTVQVGDDYSVTVRPGWAVEGATVIAARASAKVTTFADCVV